MEVLIDAFSFLAGSRNQLRRLGFSRLPCKALSSGAGRCQRRYDPAEQNTNTCNRPQDILHRPKYIPTAQTYSKWERRVFRLLVITLPGFTAVGDTHTPNSKGRPTRAGPLSFLTSTAYSAVTGCPSVSTSMDTRATPDCVIFSFSAAAYDRSITRPFTSAARSVIRTTTDL